MSLAAGSAGGSRQGPAGVGAAQLPQPVQPVHPMHSGAGPGAAVRVAAEGWLFVAHRQVLQLQAVGVEVQVRRSPVQPLINLMYGG